MAGIGKNDFNLNISRTISTAAGEETISLADTHATHVAIESEVRTATRKAQLLPRRASLATPAAAEAVPGEENSQTSPDPAAA